MRPVDAGDDKPLTVLLEQHPYLASDLGLLLIDRASGEENDLVGKLPSSSTEPTKTPCLTPGSTLPPSTGAMAAAVRAKRLAGAVREIVWRRRPAGRPRRQGVSDG